MMSARNRRNRELSETSCCRKVAKYEANDQDDLGPRVHAAFARTRRVCAHARDTWHLGNSSGAASCLVSLRSSLSGKDELSLKNVTI